MIHSDLLKTLGWQQDLIEEVLRTADSLRGFDAIECSPAQSFLISSVGSSSRVSNGEIAINTSSSITVNLRSA